MASRLPEVANRAIVELVIARLQFAGTASDVGFLFYDGSFRNAARAGE
jgi:hypothetical protein